MLSIVKSILIVGLAQVAVSLPIHYQASFDTSTFHVSTPETLHQCTPALFAWTPTTGPYYLSITTSPTPYDDDLINGDRSDTDTDGDVVVIPHATSASWIVDVREGQQVTVEVKDSEGRVAETITRMVGSGPVHCL